MSLATTSPELMVSVISVLKGQVGLALGNVFGSFVANIGLVLGVAGLIRPIKVSYIIIHRQIPFMIAALMVLVISSLGPYIEMWEVVAMLAGLVGWLIWLVCNVQGDEGIPDMSLDCAWWVTVVWFVMGVASMQWGSGLIIASAESLALVFGVKPYVVGLTVVAVGTSLPELASGVYGAIRGESSLVLGNVLGANVLLLLLVLPVIFLTSSTHVVLSDKLFDYLFMGLTSVFLWLFSMGFDQEWEINRYEAVIMLSVFGVYQFLLLR